MLEKDINEAAQMTSVCADEWCEATEYVIDELSPVNREISVEPVIAFWTLRGDSKKSLESWPHTKYIL